MEPRLEPGKIKIRDLVQDYRGGRIVIPEFQREYVWSRSKAAKLIDSLNKQFPISSLLLWRSSESTRSRRRDPRPTRAGTIDWLIDGQQRVITLSRVMSGDEGIHVVFNPDKNEFALANAATKKDRNWIEVAQLWDDQSYRHIRRNTDLEGASHAERKEQQFENVRRILDYEIPYVRMVDHSFRNAVDAFQRINTLGVRLKKEDIESAQIAAVHTGFIADEVSPFLEKIRGQGFVRMNVMHLFRACAFVARPDGRNRTPLHELSHNEVSAAWRATQKATEDAIGIVRSELGLVNMDILWSGALMVPLIAMCATMKPKERDAQEMTGWLSLATLMHRYSGSSETALDQDLRACRSSDPIGSLLTNLRSHRPSLEAREHDFSGSVADRSGLLALYIACMHRGILDFYTGARILLQVSIDRHHILPRAQFPEKERAAADYIANFAFISGGVNRAIGMTGPEVYLKQLDPEILKSQCIPLDKKLWAIDKAEAFWAARRELLAESFNDYVRKTLARRHLM